MNKELFLSGMLVLTMLCSSCASDTVSSEESRSGTESSLSYDLSSVTDISSVNNDSQADSFPSDSYENSYKQISQSEASEMMQRDDGHIIIDVRRQDEFDSGHIPGAVCIPNEDIGIEPPEALPDKEQIILVYCRSGNRSKKASQKLYDMGYKNVYEFGGIIDWTGEVVTDDSPAQDIVP